MLYPFADISNLKLRAPPDKGSSIHSKVRSTL